MKILISEIPDEGLNLEFDEPLESDVVKIISPVKGKYNIRKIGTEVVIQGEMTVNVELSCSRCLKDFTTGINIPVNVMYRPVDELKSEAQHEIKEDELDTGFYAGDEFDLQELIKEQILLNIPMKPLCSEVCRGICPGCGADLNVIKCGCGVNETDPRLAVLKKLLKKE